MGAHPFDKIKAAQAADGEVSIAQPPAIPAGGTTHPFDIIKASLGGCGVPPKPLTRTSMSTTIVADVGRLVAYQAVVSAALSAMAPMADLADRARYKRETALPQIREFVEKYLASGDQYPNDVAVRALIWAFDVGEIEFGLKLGLHLIKQACHVMPAKFDRDMPTFVCDAVYDWANAQLAAEQSAAPYLDELIHAIDTDRWSLHPAVHSKLLAMAAKHAKRAGDWSVVVERCEAAQRVNPDGAGVKTLLAEARTKLT